MSAVEMRHQEYVRYLIVAFLAWIKSFFKGLIGGKAWRRALNAKVKSFTSPCGIWDTLKNVWDGQWDNEGYFLGWLVSREIG